MSTKISGVEIKIAETSGLVTTTAFNTKLSEVESRIPSISGDVKIKDIKGKYFTTANCNKFTSDIRDVKIKWKELFNKSDIDKILINIDTKNTSNKTKHIKADKKLTLLTRKVARMSEKRYEMFLLQCLVCY